MPSPFRALSLPAPEDTYLKALLAKRLPEPADTAGLDAAQRDLQILGLRAQMALVRWGYPEFPTQGLTSELGLPAGAHPARIAQVIVELALQGTLPDPEAAALWCSDIGGRASAIMIQRHPRADRPLDAVYLTLLALPGSWLFETAPPSGTTVGWGFTVSGVAERLHASLHAATRSQTRDDVEYVQRRQELMREGRAVVLEHIRRARRGVAPEVGGLTQADLVALATYPDPSVRALALQLSPWVRDTATRVRRDSLGR
jgi:hypothetical protein